MPPKLSGGISIVFVLQSPIADKGASKLYDGMSNATDQVHLWLLNQILAVLSVRAHTAWTVRDSLIRTMVCHQGKCLCLFLLRRLQSNIFLNNQHVYFCIFSKCRRVVIESQEPTNTITQQHIDTFKKKKKCFDLFGRRICSEKKKPL